ncbi:transcriptional regulator [Streptomyces sp. SID2888]|nr:transcriptional regulator [Streptomyces sp. SID2888]
MPLRSDWSGETCPIARALDVLGDPWTLLILREAFSGSGRFEEFRARLGAADNILTNRLRRLVEEGLLARVPVAPGARRHLYRLTAAGAETLPILNAYALWGARHTQGGESGDAIGIQCTTCGATATSADTCTRCGSMLTAHTTAWARPDVADGGFHALAGPV